jgi:two-component system chemotaxis response regulator CheB
MEANIQKNFAQVRVLVADDSPTVRLMICRMLDTDPTIRIVGIAGNGREAIDQVALLKPDLVTMDVNMPVMDGLTAIEQIMAYNPVPILVVSSVIDRENTANAARALGAGAIDVMPKPAPQSLEEFNGIAADLQAKVKLLSKVRVITHPRARLQEQLFVTPAPRPQSGQQLVAIASSTGGPQALECILTSLPGDLAAGVVIVQHIAEGFTDGLVEWLAGKSRLKVRKGADGEEVRRGDVVIAPDCIHMIVEPGNRIRLVDRLVPSPHKPSADVLLESVASACGADAIGVILTGMGRDGARGMKAIHDRGGHTIAQDATTSVIFSMAKEAIQMGGVEKIAPLQEISRVIVEMT